MANGYFGIEFRRQGVFFQLYVRFWCYNQLCRTFIHPTGHMSGQLSAEVCLLTYSLSSFSTNLSPSVVLEVQSTLLACRKVSATGKKIPEPHLIRRLFLCPLDLQEELQCLRANPLHFLVISLEGSLEYEWTLFTPELTEITVYTDLSDEHFRGGCVRYNTFNVRYRPIKRAV